MKRAGKAVRLATVHELRFGVADPSQKKSDLYVTNMAEDGLPTIVDVGVTHSLADTYFSQNTSVGVRGYAADRYAKSKDTGYKKVIRDNQLHSRSAVMETYGAFSKDLGRQLRGRDDAGVDHLAQDDQEVLAVVVVGR